MEDLLEDNQQKAEPSSFDVKHYFFKLLSNYQWILFTLIIALFSAFIYLRYTTPQYKVSGHILVGGGALESGANKILTNAGLANASENSVSGIGNEIFILKSHKINSQVVDSLQLDILITKLGRLKDQALLKDSLPITIRLNKLTPNSQSPLFKLSLRKNGYIMWDGKRKYIGRYGKSIIIKSDIIIIDKKSGVNIVEDDYSFQLISRLAATKKYLSRLTVEPAKNGGTGLLKISVTDELPARAKRYIDVLINSYNLSYFEFKNQAIHRALTFLGERLKTVSRELREHENQVRDFKANNRLYNISSTASELLSNLQSLDVQKSQSDYQADLLSLVEKSMKVNSGAEEIVASANGLQDPILNSQVIQYNDLVFQKQTIQNSGTKADPRLVPLNDQIASLRDNILKNIGNIRNQFKAGQSSVYSQENKFTNKFQDLPEKEKQYVELNRKLSIKESQYIFLLQKKEETEIQLVSSDTEISRTVDDILSEGTVSPLRLQIYGLAIAIGLLLPCLIILIRILIKDKIETRSEIERGTNVPILGELSMSQSLEPIAISANNRSAIAEQLRAIRTNLSFINASENNKVYIVTSATSGEGKSFVSLNFGNSIAISNKKVAVLELDLRKPMISKKLGVHNKKGISNYLVDSTLKPEDIINELSGYPNLFLLNSGPIPPNPGELIINPRMADLIAYLRNNFDCVILDSPPVGLVADSISLAKLADISLYVVRPNYSERSSLSLVSNLQSFNKLPNLSLIINGIQANKGYSGYGNYGYGYGYYSDDALNKENKIIKLFKKIFNHS